MKTKIITIFICLLVLIPWGYAQKNKEPYFSQIIATPNKTLNFTVFLFHHKYRWVESKTEGNYSSISLVIKNDKNAPPLEWKDYKVYLLLKDGRLLHNYTTVAKTGNFACTYTAQPDKHHVQLLCFGKKFTPDQIDRVWVKMTHANFISLKYSNPGGASPLTQ